MLARVIDRFGRILTTRNARSYGRFDPADTAVLVLSPQVDLFTESGKWTEICDVRPNRQGFCGFLDECRKRGWRIYHSPMAWTDESDRSAVGATRHFHELRARGLLRLGQPGTELEPTLAASSDHVLPSRSGLNAFVGTGFLKHLQQDQRGRLIIAGGVANADMDSSARAAVEYDLDVTVVSDLTFAYSAPDLHNEISITLPRLVARVFESSEILDSTPDTISN